MPSHNPRDEVRGKHASIPLDDSLNSKIPNTKFRQSKESASDKAAIYNADHTESDVKPHVAADVEQVHVTVHQPHNRYQTIRYLNGDALNRPFELPRSENRTVIFVIIAAIVLAAFALYFYFDKTANAPVREQEVVADMLKKSVPLNLPDMLSLVGLDDEEIDSALKSSGDTLYERSPVGSGAAYNVVRLPEGVSVAEAASLYLTGINKISASQAALLLNGSWDLSIDRKNGINMSLHYADFKSSSVRSAINNAISEEDLERNGQGDSGEDDGYGNAYSTGQVKIDGATYNWTVSAIPLKQIYSISGLPSNAVYVGVRIKTL